MLPFLRSRLLLYVVGAGALGALVLGALAGLGLLEAGTALGLAAMGVVGAAVAAVAVMVRRLGRRVNRLSRELEGRMGEAVRAVEEHQARTGASFEEHQARTGASFEEMTAELARLRDETLPKLSRDVIRTVTMQGRTDYEQQVAWTELRDYLKPGPFMPPLRGWAASPDVLRLLVRIIDERRPELVVECGSGSSSVWLGYALRQVGSGRLVALEHEERYAELSRELVTAHGLDDIVDVRHAPLTDWVPEEGSVEDPAQPWYDLKAVADLKEIGLVFVDGPPGATSPQARYPAVPALLPHCAPDVIIVLDDTVRRAERDLSDRWLAAYPELSCRPEPVEKGARVFTRNAL
ncbi:O-methyltransferase [Streptomyces himalayensis]|uniref:Class I SAM-dependent methyltransferase n=1 Tax=Streptomyces himalayensis subsp. himalayensis TaxID=2756131 RepID=A0A7W0ICR1_9ACTN|nr:class I SAM-dependent methyltransferase [Streptomyces himalayensis]MBA2950823.1 class I SAM-dependent methyltransferase [Streptomyces himalayensis subsp. himalayensis]